MLGKSVMLTMGVLLASSIVACGDSSNTGTGGAGGGTAKKPCNEDPFQCAAGQTCWPNQQVTAFDCLASGAGKQGDACQLVGGQVSCGDGLICIATTDPMKGTCTPYCDPKNPGHGCPNGEVCGTFKLTNNGLTLSACLANGGTTSSSSSSSSSSTSSSTSSSSSSSSSATSSSASTGTGN